MSKAAAASDRTTTTQDNRPPPIETVLREKHPEIFKRVAAWQRRARAAKLPPKTLADCAALDAIYLAGREIRNDADGIRQREAEEPFRVYQAINALFNGEVRDVIGSEAKDYSGLANRIKQAAADRRLALTREEQAKAFAASEAARVKAEEEAERAAKTEERGEVRVADAQRAGAVAIAGEADRLGAFAAKPVIEASRSIVGGVRSSVDAKMVCTAVNRADIQLQPLLPYLKSDVIVDAVNAYLKATGEKAFAGAVVEERAVGKVGR